MVKKLLFKLKCKFNEVMNVLEQQLHLKDTYLLYNLLYNLFNNLLTLSVLPNMFDFLYSLENKRRYLVGIFGALEKRKKMTDSHAT